MGSRIYNRFIELVQRWPVDTTRPGRDLGERLRKVITEEFPQGPISKVDDRKLNADLDAYTRLTNNIYFNKYPRKYPNSSVTELDREKLRVATSTEGMNILSGKEKK